MLQLPSQEKTPRIESPLSVRHPCITSTPKSNPLANSVHLGIELIFQTRLRKVKQPQTIRKIWKYELADFNHANELIDEYDWNSILCNDIEESWKNWKQHFLDIMNQTIPHTFYKQRKKSSMAQQYSNSNHTEKKHPF